MMDILGRLRELMAEHDWSEYRLGVEADINPGTISQMFQRNSIPEIPSLEKMAGAFGLTLSQFFAGDGEAVPLAPREKEMLEAWSFLSATQQDLLLSVALNMRRPEK